MKSAETSTSPLAIIDPAGAPQTELALLLIGLQSPINLGLILRVAETYQVGVAIAGSDSVIDAEDRIETVGDFACGALQRKGFSRAASIEEMLPRLSGRRLIATSVESDAASLASFVFERGDIVLLGNEYDGLPDDVVKRCARTLRIPMADMWTPKPPSSNPIDASRTQTVAREGTPSLNVAMAAGIICYQWFVGAAAQAENCARS